MNKESKPIYYPAFDYLRIALATVVVIGHSGLSIWSQSGNYSVQVFFALSGWLIGGILLDSKSEDLPRFYFNRAARIWTPYFAAIMLLMSVSLMKDTITAKWLEIFFYDVTFVYNFFGPPQLATFKNMMPLQGTGNNFWSICAEEQFYLVAPILLLLAGRLGRSILVWCGIGAAAVFFANSNDFGAISLGVLAAVVRTHFGDWHHETLPRVALALLAILLFTMTFTEFIPYQIGAATSAICIVLFFAQRGEHSKIGSFLGGISFPVYLNHWLGVFMANALFERTARDTFLCHILGIIFGLTVGAIMYLLIDRNVRKYRDQFFTTKRGGMVAACGYSLVLTGLIGGLIITR